MLRALVIKAAFFSVRASHREFSPLNWNHFIFFTGFCDRAGVGFHFAFRFFRRILEDRFPDLLNKRDIITKFTPAAGDDLSFGPISPLFSPKSKPIDFRRSKWDPFTSFDEESFNVFEIYPRFIFQNDAIRPFGSIIDPFSDNCLLRFVERLFGRHQIIIVHFESQHPVSWTILRIP